MRLKKGSNIRGFFTAGAAWMLVLLLSLPLANCAKKNPPVKKKSEAVEKSEQQAAELKKAQSTIKSMQGEIAALQKKINNGTATEEDKQRLAELEAKLKEVEGKAQKTEEALSVANESLGEAKETIATQGTALTGAQGAITSLKKAVVLQVTSANATSYRTIEVQFNDAFDQDDAVNLSHYALKGANPSHPGAAGIKVVSVKPLKGNKKVELMLNKRLISMKYTLEVNAIKALNPDIEGKEYSTEIIPDGARMIFISDATSNGDLRNFTNPYDHKSQPMDTANNLCQQEAQAAQLEGTFEAMVPDKDLPNYFATEAHYIRPDALSPTRVGPGKNMYDSIEYQYGAELSLPIDIKADGQHVAYDMADTDTTSASLFAFTGVDTYDDYQLACRYGGPDWTVADRNSVGESLFRSRHANLFVGVDLQSALNANFMGAQNRCALPHRVFCIQTESAAKNKAPAWQTFDDFEEYSGDNYVFVSSESVSANIADTVPRLKGGKTGNTGILAADELCEHLAETTIYAGNNASIKKAVQSIKKNASKYRAIISGQQSGTGNQIHAKDRFSTSPLANTGAYHLLNGIKVMDSMADLFDPEKGLKAPIAMTEKGQYLVAHNNREFYHLEISMLNSLVFTGTEIDGQSTGEHCGSWTTNDQNHIKLTVGDANDAFFSLNGAAKSVFEEKDLNCSMKARIYCAYDADKQ